MADLKNQAKTARRSYIIGSQDFFICGEAIGHKIEDVIACPDAELGRLFASLEETFRFQAELKNYERRWTLAEFFLGHDYRKQISYAIKQREWRQYLSRLTGCVDFYTLLGTLVAGLIVNNTVSLSLMDAGMAEKFFREAEALSKDQLIDAAMNRVITRFPDMPSPLRALLIEACGCLWERVKIESSLRLVFEDIMPSSAFAHQLGRKTKKAMRNFTMAASSI